jgi:hypothetical protein
VSALLKRQAEDYQDAFNRRNPARTSATLYYDKPLPNVFRIVFSSIEFANELCTGAKPRFAGAYLLPRVVNEHGLRTKKESDEAALKRGLQDTQANAEAQTAILGKMEILEQDLRDTRKEARELHRGTLEFMAEQGKMMKEQSRVLAGMSTLLDNVVSQQYTLTSAVQNIQAQQMRIQHLDMEARPYVLELQDLKLERQMAIQNSGFGSEHVIDVDRRINECRAYMDKCDNQKRAVLFAELSIAQGPDDRAHALYLNGNDEEDPYSGDDEEEAMNAPVKGRPRRMADIQEIDVDPVSLSTTPAKKHIYTPAYTIVNIITPKMSHLIYAHLSCSDAYFPAPPFHNDLYCPALRSFPLARRKPHKSPVVLVSVPSDDHAWIGTQFVRVIVIAILTSSGRNSTVVFLLLLILLIPSALASDPTLSLLTLNVRQLTQGDTSPKVQGIVSLIKSQRPSIFILTETTILNHRMNDFLLRQLGRQYNFFWTTASPPLLTDSTQAQTQYSVDDIPIIDGHPNSEQEREKPKSSGVTIGVLESIPARYGPPIPVNFRYHASKRVLHLLLLSRVG